jgi:chromosome partitioning protein
MTTIAILNQKGGSGKTTLAIHLSRGLQREGQRVLLVDADPQGSARDWAAAHDDQPLAVVGLDRPSLDRDVKKIADGRDYVIIDGAPALHEMTAAAIRCADVVLIPVQPSPLDVWAASELVELVKTRQSVTGGTPVAALVISRAIRGTRVSRDIDAIVAEFGLPVLSERIHQRVAYSNSMAKGASVFDSDEHHDAVEEMRAIVTAIRNLVTPQLLQRVHA